MNLGIQSAEKPSSATRKNEPKQQHYVPKMLLKRFVGAEPQLWYFDKSNARFGVKRKPIANLFVKKQLYTTFTHDGARDWITETRLSALETRTGPVFDKITTAARQGKLPGLSQDDRATLCAFFIAQFKRSPDFFRPALERQNIEAGLEDYISEWEAARGPAPAEALAIVRHPRYASRLRHNLAASSAAEPLEHSSPTMMSRGFAVGVITAPNRSFVIGSSPFARLRSRKTGRQDLGDPDAELWMPIAPDVALASYGRAGAERVTEISGDQGVSRINDAIFHGSTVIASASRALICALSRRYVCAHQTRS